MRLKQAQTIAEGLKADVEPFCDRVEIGGSIRRKKPDVGDIELICIPTFAEVGTGQATLTGGETTVSENLLFGHLARHYHVMKMGEKYCQIATQELKVDVFSATPETWGYILLLRTGPAKFSKFIVSELKKRGFTPKDGAILLGDEPIPTIEEIVVFQHLLISYIEPECRFKDMMWK